MTKTHYNSLNDYLKKRFGERVYKVTLESGCGCPNRDGTLGESGCVYCNELSYNPATNPGLSRDNVDSVENQLEEGIAYVRKRHGAGKFIAYFQNGSNTYGPINKLKDMYEKAARHPNVVGLAVSTRPDCLSNIMLDVLQEISTRTFLWVELGLQSAHDESLARIGRGHTVSDFVAANESLQERGIQVCAHVILGLPGEVREHFLQTARFLNEQKVWGVKIHNLHVLRDTVLAKEYDDGLIKLMTLDEYAESVADFIGHLSKDIVIHRFNSHSPRDLTVAPEWSINKLAVFNAVEKALRCPQKS